MVAWVLTHQSVESVYCHGVRRTLADVEHKRGGHALLKMEKETDILQLRNHNGYKRVLLAHELQVLKDVNRILNCGCD